MVFESATFFTSSYASNLYKNYTAYLVFSTFSSLSSITNGNYGTYDTLCPLAYTNGTKAVAAKAEATACLFY